MNRTLICRSLRAAALSGLSAFALSLWIVPTASAGGETQPPHNFDLAAALHDTAFTDGRGFDEDPQVASDSTGRMMAVWASNHDLDGEAGTDSDILAVVSSDSGATWSSTQLVNSFGKGDAAIDLQPDIATNGQGRWIVVWRSTQDVGGIGGEGDILFAVSDNLGGTWTEATALDIDFSMEPEAGGAFDENPSIVSDGGETWIVAWATETNLVEGGGAQTGALGNDFDIVYSRSINNGATWSAAAPLQTNAFAEASGAALHDTEEDRFVRLAADGMGTWNAVWESTDTLVGAGLASIGTDSDILTARSVDNGASWSAPRPLLPLAQTDGSATDTFPAIAADSRGDLLVAWISTADPAGTTGTDSDVFAAVSRDGGETWTLAPTPDAEAVSDGNTGDNTPAVATDGNGNWLVAWTSEDLEFSFRIHVSRSRSFGASWVESSPVRPTVLERTEVDPALASGASGAWVLIWSSTEDLADGPDSTGTDFDLLYSRVPFLPLLMTGFAAR